MKIQEFKRKIEEILDTRCLSFEPSICGGCAKRAEALKELINEAEQIT